MGQTLSILINPRLRVRNGTEMTWEISGMQEAEISEFCSIHLSDTHVPDSNECNLVIHGICIVNLPNYPLLSLKHLVLNLLSSPSIYDFYVKILPRLSSPTMCPFRHGDCQSRPCEGQLYTHQVCKQS
jgi:hypothetical protein